ncbi:hypothetical protein AGABI2DRAFT_185635 [Agaricus bisporus var. bisporus H97]|uniref:hypothetical protein n=1 Tax=Agaricus bisporus var. bisporus (strain H97 / ATCC MYA-4626 / FGSC 10389) TaxID=936046 RepID=UPI00029F53BE|nr:hypothetical protein AGABI2DRAFT_185635 [Agaricus bisporus var. bisporus H97]EKV47727.1 hypothetical protein AGABI2DRAFT_185635 [Agaricus bisporus var. bisporus H97]
MWVVCSSKNSAGQMVVDFVLSITEGNIDSYPLFFSTSLPVRQLTQDFVVPRMQEIVKALANTSIPVERVYAVYGPDTLARVFAKCWTTATGVANLSNAPYYAAKLSFCTRGSFRDRPVNIRGDFTFEIRPANVNDIPQIAQCNYGFAADGPPYTLTQEGAHREANYQVAHNLIWIHRITRRGSSVSEVASIVAFSRNSTRNATITKVYTDPGCRRMGCAERLVREVTKFLLGTKETVSLFVAHDNPGAAHVYSRVGFVGLNPQEGSVPGVDNWTEIGFDRNAVRLGHW